MPSYLTPDEEADYRGAMTDLHDTFSRDIFIYQTAQKIVISTNPNHNFLYASGPNQTEVQTTVVKGSYRARIWYPNEEELSNLVRSGGSQNSDQVNVEVKDYKVILVVDLTVKNILKSAEKVTFDDTVYQVVSDPRPHGVIGVQFYNIYLKGLN